MPVKLITGSFMTAALLISLSFRESTDIKPIQIFHQMYDSIRNIRTVKQKVWAIERIEKRFSSNHSEVVIQTQPRKVLYHNPSKKLKVLYDAQVATDKALVKPNIFPYMTMSLDPRGNIMRRNQHYSIHELGYEFIGKSIALTINKDKAGLDNFHYRGKVQKNGYSCYLVEYENNAYGYTNYTVGEKESATLIAYRLNVNDYLLRYRNNLLNDFGYLKKGTVLKVPNLYCRKAVLYIDEKMMVPVALSLYDDTGLFESYEYTQIELNKPLHPRQFDPAAQGF